MDHEQLWETTMNPKTRYLKQIEIEDAILASKLQNCLWEIMQKLEENSFKKMQLLQTWIYKKINKVNSF